VTPGQRTWLGWAPAAVWAACIFVLSSQPALPSPGNLNDKQAHAIAYGLLACLCLMGLTGWRWRRIAGASLLAAFVASVVYGLFDEIHQAFVPGRSPEVADVIADAAGAAIALAAAWAWAILLGRRSSIQRS
jgi:VanZ family protein